VDPQLIIIAIVVLSAAIAGLGLLLSWYRREGRKDEHKSKWPFIAAGTSILVLAVTGVALTFLFGADTKNTSASPELSTGAISSSVPTRLSEAQYRDKVSAACSEAKERAKQVNKSKPQETPFGAQIEIEQREIGQIEALQPPDKLKSAHESMVSVWRHRISLLESINHRLPELNHNERAAELAAVDRLAKQMTESFKLIGVSKCIM
jgi:hypothetical protein